MLDVYLITVVLFCFFTLGVLFFPLRWALACLMLVMQVDVTQAGFEGTTSMGWYNAVRALVLPVFLLWRLGPRNLPKVKWTRPTRLWAVFVAYATLSLLWSSYTLPGVKMVGYFACYFFLYWVFYWAWRRALIDEVVVVTSLWCSLALACFQSFVLGNPIDPGDHRFTSFVWPQEFAPYLVSVLAFLLFQPGKSRLRTVSIASCCLAVILTGSRFAFIGMVFLFFTVWLHRGLALTGRSRIGAMSKALLATFFIVFTVRLVVGWAAPTSRMNELLELGATPERTVEDISTLSARLLVYQATLAELSLRGVPGIIFGSGTSSGADIAVRHNLEGAVPYDPSGLPNDANRLICNEFLRVLYEWGLIGLVIMALLLIPFISCTWRLALRERSLAGFALLGLLPTILGGLLTENVLASASFPPGLGFVMVITGAFSVNPKDGEATSMPIAREA